MTWQRRKLHCSSPQLLTSKEVVLTCVGQIRFPLDYLTWTSLALVRWCTQPFGVLALSSEDQAATSRDASSNGRFLFRTLWTSRSLPTSWQQFFWHAGRLNLNVFAFFPPVLVALCRSKHVLKRGWPRNCWLLFAGAWSKFCCDVTQTRQKFGSEKCGWPQNSYKTATKTEGLNKNSPILYVGACQNLVTWGK